MTSEHSHRDLHCPEAWNDNEAARVAQFGSHRIQLARQIVVKNSSHKQLKVFSVRINFEPDIQTSAARVLIPFDIDFKPRRTLGSNSTQRDSVRYPLKGSDRFQRAQENLAPAQGLVVNATDGGPVALMDAGWADELVADENLVAALALGRRVVALTEQNAPQGPLVDELIAEGIALARLKNAEHSEFMFKTAITVAVRARAQDKVALAALTMIEELDQLSARTMYDAFEMALEIPDSMGTELLRRVSQAGVKVIHRALAKRSNQETTEVDSKLPMNLEYEMLLYERSIFKNALVDAKGSLVQAARFVGLQPRKLFRRLRVEHQVLLHRLRPPVRLPREE